MEKDLKKLTRKSEAEKKHYFQGTDAPWYKARELSEEDRTRFRTITQTSSKEKRLAIEKYEKFKWVSVNTPRLDPNILMPQLPRTNIKAISLFSGCGGLDLGFDKAGFEHYASHDILTKGCETILSNRPTWTVFSGEDGNVRKKDWKNLKGKIDVIHGGPPCQPFSVAGKQLASADSRDLFPEFVRAVLEIEPTAFVAENVSSLAGKKFENYLDEHVYSKVSRHYKIFTFKLRAGDFGVPQSRERFFIVGTHKRKCNKEYAQPKPTHFCDHLIPRNQKNKSVAEILRGNTLPLCMGVREALGLELTDHDVLAPTIRSTLTGPRQTTSILSSSAAQKVWASIGIWANGVQASRELAQNYPAKFNHFRLSVPDCKVLQGFPDDWKFEGPVYLQLGLLGNSVAPPMAYHVAKSLLSIL